MKHLSICIPTYEMHGKGTEFLEYSFIQLEKQSFKDFEVVVSDHSKDNAVEQLCTQWNGRLDIVYIRNTEKRGSSSANLNCAIRNAKGAYIKFLMQDDYLFSANALATTVEALGTNGAWLASACTHTTDTINTFRPFYPAFNAETILKKNTLSSPSTITIKNDKTVWFDDDLLWWTDTDFYKRYYEQHGQPILLNEITVVNRIGEHQVSNTYATESIKLREYAYILKKYKARFIMIKMAVYKMKMYKRILKQKIKARL